MSSGSYRSWATRSAGRSSHSVRSYRSFSSRPSSSCSLVESNFRVSLPETPVVPEVYINRRPKTSRTREISINDSPMMLLPKARVRDSLDYYDSFRRSYSVVADTSVQGLHISTIQSINGLETRLPSKSALKSRRNSISRSEADSGFHSLKRTVTFENLNNSQSTVFRSDDDSDNMSDTSDYSDSDKRVQTETEEIPDHLESFGSEDVVITEPRSRSQSRQSQHEKRRKHGQNGDHDAHACEICGMVLTEKERVNKKFGKVDSFLDWVMSKWGPRRELQYIPRASYVYRGHAPHFCNFVQQVSLHNRQDNGTNSTGIPDSEFDDADFILESADGRMINKYRKSSTARPSGTEGRPGSPSSLDGDSQQDIDGQQPVTGIEVRVSSPCKMDGSSKSDNRVPVNDNTQSSHSGSMIPEEDVGHKEQTTSTPVGWENTEGLNSYKEPVDNVAGVSDSNNRIPSPRQPPPSPEPVKLKSKKLPPEVPLPVTAADTTKKRSCVSKKTKKPVERKRKMKQIEEVKPPEPIKTEEALPPEITTNQNETVTSKVDLKVPDLPSNLDNKDKQRKEKSKVKKHLIEIEDDLLRPDANEILNEQMKLNRTEFDWSNMDTNGTEDVKRQPQIKSWIQGRLALSQQSSRFELPMDMKNLEKMTPQEYIRKHCIITSRRQNLYQKIFLKNKDKTQAILYKDLDRSLKDVLVNTITSDQIQEVLHTLQVDESTKVDYKLFAGMAAFAERVLYPQFVTEDTEGMPEYQREKIECADFCALPWKLHGVNVNPEMKKLLEQIS